MCITIKITPTSATVPSSEEPKPQPHKVWAGWEKQNASQDTLLVPILPQVALSSIAC